MTHRFPARSFRQADARARYDAYIASAAWTKRRRRWLAVERHSHTGVVRCRSCGCIWGTKGSGGELHHLTYERLGAEDHCDLVALCRSCHRVVEARYGDDPGWHQYQDRAVAMRAIVERRSMR